MPASDHETDCLPKLNNIKATLRRADEASDLLDAVKSLIIPYIRAADDAAPSKVSGRVQHTNVLVDAHSPQDLLARFNFSLPAGTGRGKDGLLDTIQDVLRYSVNTWDQGFMDKLTAATNPVGLISELVLGVLNTNVHVYHVSPALTVVEKVTAKALASYFGFNGPRAGGVTCQGGSASNFTSLVIARNALYPETKFHGADGHRFAVFTSEHGHFSVQKAAVASGMGASAIVSVPVDDVGRMDVSALRRLVLEAQAQGRTPLYVNSTAGTTVMGMYDPIREIKAVCDEFGMWLHIDGSWGASVAFSSKHRNKLDGTELADSLTINPQKMLNVPMTCSFLLTNDLGRFHDANSLRAGYLFHDDPEENGEVWDLADLTLQCGRRADSLKFALAWIYHGAAGFEEGIDHAFDMANLLTALVSKSIDFDLVSQSPPSCLQVCFYYIPGGKITDSKEENTRRTKSMVHKMLARGFMFDFAPGPRGHFFRVVVNCQTLPGTIEGLFKGLNEVGREVIAE
ncbi:Pyridoxal phosphate-dependent decarboxylase [Fusarium albosuccineum]|uniref:Pyridoxal phosphate-dependent decarboxylase n=1 Tax=Fusarium albosuccineum TaxID=1237068 RepID=A0A8H4LBV0_9HYPO|nr:Pyridoxal phosphate-dependent decarboxylase [Fusarium albosuccineum]